VVARTATYLQFVFLRSVAGPVVFDGSGSDTDDDDDDDVSPDEFHRQEAILSLVVGVRQYLNDLEAITQVR
jgi:hypothetical protein